MAAPTTTMKSQSHSNSPTTKSFEDDEVEHKHPMETRNIFTRMTIHWLQPLISLGYRKTLQMEDIPEVASSWASEKLEAQLRAWWDLETLKEKANLLWCIVRCYKREYAHAAVYMCLGSFGHLINPLLVKNLLVYINNPDTDESLIFGFTEGWQLALALLLFSMFQTVFMQYGFSLASILGVKIRGAVMASIYRKALKISAESRQSESSAENLMSNDAERIFMTLLTSNILWMSVILITMVAVLLILEVGVAGACGMALMLMVGPIQAHMARKLSVMKRGMLTYSDKRVKFIGEILNGINVVKICSWENEMQGKVAEVRGQEMKLDRRILFTVALNTWLLFVIPILVALVVFLVYMGLGNELTVERVYAVLVFLDVARIPIIVMPRAVADLSQAIVSLRRIQAFLQLPESSDVTDEYVESDDTSDDDPTKNQDVVIMKNASFSWFGPKSTNLALRDVNLRIRRGSLCVIVGRVGSGKTSLVSGIINEIEKTSGTMIVQHSHPGRAAAVPTSALSMRFSEDHLNKVERTPIAYVSQEPWIQNESIRNNIVFKSSLFESNNEQVDKPVDETLLKQALDASQLGPDIAILQEGLNTEIGERGVNLSGGQKSRVTIARALYRAIRYELDMVVFDDPFSALDPAVGQNVFDEVLLSTLGDRTRIVVLNSHLHLLDHADQVVVVEDGQIAGVGKPKEILHKPEFAWLGKQVQVDAELREGSTADPSAIPVDIESVPVAKEVPHDVSVPHKVREATSVASVGAADNKTMQQSGDEDAKQHDDGTLYTKEDRKVGAVERLNYVRWVGAGVGNSKHPIVKYLVILLILALMTLAQASKIASEYMLGFWAESPSLDDSRYLAVYVVLVILAGVLKLAATIFFMHYAVKSAVNLHNSLVKSILQAPLNLFFDVTPTGRILNRFSNDIDKVDQRLPETMHNFIQNLLKLLSAVSICIASSWWFVLVLLPLTVIFGFVVVYFSKTSREVKRLEGVSRSPVFSNFGESLAGLSTIRAFGMERYFQEKSDALMDSNAKVFLVFWMAARWLAIRVDMIAILVQFTVAMLAVSSIGSVPPEVMGLALVYALQMTGMLQFTVRMSIETENYMTSVERLCYYTGDNIPQEAPAEIPETRPPGYDNSPAIPGAETWPSKGEIVVENLSMRYRPHLDLVLKGLSLKIGSHEKVGICGRTGAGKSTFLCALFRLIDPPDSGRILIDGVDIATLGLRDLRTKLAIIPQMPTLFSGSVRFNIDPWGTSSDADIWMALERVQLAQVVREMPGLLDGDVTANGGNFSVGQRQLICIARALLKQCKVVLMDEATANVDKETDRLIQDAIRQNFKNATVMTIAHRINTIIDSDKIAVLDYGQLKEFGTPAELIEQGGIFAEMVEQSGQEES